MNKLEDIANKLNGAVREMNSFKNSITDEKGLYEVCKILLNAYINNHPMPYSELKGRVIKSFFKDMDEAYEKIKGDYK